MNYAVAKPSMDPTHRTKWVLLAFAAVLLVAIIAGSIVVRHMTRDRFVIPDEKAAAAVLLEQKLSGPRYFQREPAVEPAPAAHGEIRISLQAAQAQVPRIVELRRLNADQAEKLEHLLQKLAEPSPSRVAGDTTVNLLRLNLALDAVR